MTLHALLFDVDGTLADTEETHRQAFNAAFAGLDLPFTWDAAQYVDLLRVTGGKERLRHFFAALPSGERERLNALVPELHRRKTERFAELVASGGAPLRPGIARLLDEAEAAGVSVGIASTTTLDNVTALLAAELGDNAQQRFRVIACGDVVKAKKPAPDIYHHALDVLGLAAEDALAFEDSELGLAASKGAGLFTVITPNRWTEGHDFTGADLTLAHLGDATRPLEPADAARVGSPFLTLERLAALHARAGRTATGDVR